MNHFPGHKFIEWKIKIGFLYSAAWTKEQKKTRVKIIRIVTLSLWFLFSFHFLFSEKNWLKVIIKWFTFRPLDKTNEKCITNCKPVSILQWDELCVRALASKWKGLFHPHHVEKKLTFSKENFCNYLVHFFSLPYTHTHFAITFSLAFHLKKNCTEFLLNKMKNYGAEWKMWKRKIERKKIHGVCFGWRENPAGI